MAHHYETARQLPDLKGLRFGVQGLRVSATGCKGWEFSGFEGLGFKG